MNGGKQMNFMKIVISELEVFILDVIILLQRGFCTD